MGGWGFWWKYRVRKHLFSVTIYRFFFRVSLRGIKETHKPRRFFFFQKMSLKGMKFWQMQNNHNKNISREKPVCSKDTREHFIEDWKLSAEYCVQKMLPCSQFNSPCWGSWIMSSRTDLGLSSQVRVWSEIFTKISPKGGQSLCPVQQEGLLLSF